MGRLPRRHQKIERVLGISLDGYSVGYYPPSGEDRPDDMAQAWLNGNLERYEQLRSEHERTRPKYIERPRLPSGPKRKLDWEVVRAMRSQGLSIVKISRLLKCGTSQVWRILKHDTR